MTKETKPKRIKKVTYQSDEQTEIIRFVRILVIIIILVLGVYLFTRLFVTKDLTNKNENESITDGEINYTTTIIGSMLNRPEEEYYVMLVDLSMPNAVYYTGLVNNYSQNTNHLKVYTIDLSNELNKKYIGSKNNITDNLSTFQVSTNTLIKVKKGKITNFYTSEKDLEEVLKLVRENTTD